MAVREARRERGGDVATRPDSRDAPHLFGLGLKEMLADEITSDLRAIRTSAIQRAANKKAAVALPLVSKGIKYGFIKALPNGTVDTSLVDGVDPDASACGPFSRMAASFPFAPRGRSIQGRDGLEAVDLIPCAASDPAHPVTMVSPGGLVLDPALGKIKRAPELFQNSRQRWRWHRQ